MEYESPAGFARSRHGNPKAFQTSKPGFWLCRNTGSGLKGRGERRSREHYFTPRAQLSIGRRGSCNTWPTCWMECCTWIALALRSCWRCWLGDDENWERFLWIIRSLDLPGLALVLIPLAMATSDFSGPSTRNLLTHPRTVRSDESEVNLILSWLHMDMSQNPVPLS